MSESQSAAAQSMAKTPAVGTKSPTPSIRTAETTEEFDRMLREIKQKNDQWFKERADQLDEEATVRARLGFWD